jgi:hypothetical protein
VDDAEPSELNCSGGEALLMRRLVPAALGGFVYRGFGHQEKA